MFHILTIVCDVHLWSSKRTVNVCNVVTILTMLRMDPYGQVTGFCSHWYFEGD